MGKVFHTTTSSSSLGITIICKGLFRISPIGATGGTMSSSTSSTNTVGVARFHYCRILDFTSSSRRCHSGLPPLSGLRYLLGFVRHLNGLFSPTKTLAPVLEVICYFSLGVLTYWAFILLLGTFFNFYNFFLN